MNSPDNLASVIQKVDSIPKILETSQKIVVYDRKRREVLPKKPLIVRSNIEFYLVSTTSVIQYEGLAITVEDFSTNRKIGLTLAYRASCPEGNQDLLVSNLCKDSSPGLNINRRIEQWIYSITRSCAGDFIDNFVPKLSWLKRELESEAEQVGLQLDVRVALDKSAMYYLVANAKVTQNLADRENLIISIQDVANSREIGVVVTYQARLRDDKNRDKTINALGDDYDTVNDAVDEKIKEWVLQFIGTRTEQFIDNYESEIPGLRQRLENKGREELNLILSSNIDLDRNPVEHIIFNSRDTSNVARRDNLIFLVEDISQNRKVSLSVNYQAGFEPSDRDRVASAFASSKSFTGEIDKKLQTWIAQFIEHTKPEYFLDRYVTQVIELQSNLCQRAKTEVGLKLDLRVQLEKQHQLLPISISATKQPFPLTVRVKDCDDELQLRVRTDLNYDESNIVNAVLRSLPDQEIPIVNLVTKKIKEFLVESVTINEFSYELKTTVRDNLATFLNQNLLDYGRKVEFLSLESDAVTTIPQEIIEIEHRVICNVQGYSKPVEVKNIIQLLPKDLSMFRKMLPTNQKDGEPSPLDVWVKSKLDKIVKPLLLNQRYINILTKFDPIASAIKIGMENEAKLIGFSAEHIVSVPDLEHFELTREFTLDDVEGSEYLTNNTNVKVKLNTATTARIIDFTKIEAYLDKSTEDIKKLMQNAIQRVIQEKLNNVVPERYYMHFYHDDQGRSLEEEIREIIIKKLTESFGAEVKSVVARPIDTAIVTHYKELRGRIGSFKFEISPLSAGQPVKFEADFQISGVEKDSWHVFQERIESMHRSQEPRRKELKRLHDKFDNELRDYDNDDDDFNPIKEKIHSIEEELSGIDNIRKSIEKTIQRRLNLLDSDMIAYSDYRNLEAMEREINSWAREGVKSQYGLEITIENLKRDRTLEETWKSEDALKVIEGQRRAKEIHRQIMMDKVDEAVEKLEAEKVKRKIRMDMITSGTQSKANELKLLQEKRCKLIARSDYDQEELDQIDTEISRLENNLPDSSLEDMANLLKAMEPENPSPKPNFLDAMSTPDQTSISATEDSE